MNRYHFSQDVIAPPHIFPGDIFNLRGTNVFCEVLTFENGVVGYSLESAYDPDPNYMLRKEFEEKFEFDHREGSLPNMQRSSEKNEDYDGYNEDYDYFETYDDYDHLYEDDKNN